MRSTPRAVVGVLAVQGDVVEHVRMLEDVGAHAVRVRRAADLANVDALVIPGGESTVMMRLIAQGDLLEPLRERIAAGMPAYGSCAGMILLADRIIPLGAGPAASLGPSFAVDIERPRDRKALNHDPRFKVLRGQIVEYLLASARAKRRKSEAPTKPAILIDALEPV